MLNPPVPILSKSCPFALNVEIPTVMFAASFDANDKVSVIAVVPPAL